MSTRDTLHAERRLFAITGLGALAYVGIWPAPTAADTDRTENTIVDAAYPGMSKRAFAYVLRQLADRIDHQADTNDEAPLDVDHLAEADARNTMAAEAGR
ncbi:hypothetical protein SFUL_5531 [Streptomyces microflavus DSM 40593]|uniref:Uncharacterized protein n=1 Tax=Streptomyces microflavus DSM 40593 TaxID=1303692 RepID=N0CZN3_STRMI|nr:hypothetical protein [Streptomyces microflavus]AGK80419.1 hypothetical protein SFUL_5531 [Streptomyces microflavus DSM 40593]